MRKSRQLKPEILTEIQGKYREKIDWLSKKLKEHFNVPGNISIFEFTRKREFSDARRILYYILRAQNNLSFNQIGRFCGRDHATIMYAISELNDFMTIDANLKKFVDDLLFEYRNEFSNFPMLSISFKIFGQPNRSIQDCVRILIH